MELSPEVNYRPLEVMEKLVSSPTSEAFQVEEQTNRYLTRRYCIIEGGCYLPKILANAQSSQDIPWNRWFCASCGHHNAWQDSPETHTQAGEVARGRSRNFPLEGGCTGPKGITSACP